MWLGCVDASSKTAHYNLRKDRSLLIFIGGEKEQLLTKQHENKVFLRTRKGGLIINSCCIGVYSFICILWKWLECRICQACT